MTDRMRAHPNGYEHDTSTPVLAVIDPRGLPVRAVEYRCSSAGAQAIEQVSRSRHDAAGRPVADTDPRLDRPNQSTVFSLSSLPVLIESVDAGWRLSLADENANAVDRWDGRNSHWRTVFDGLARPMILVEKGQEHTEYRVIGRLSYAGFSEYAAAHNQCGRLIRKDDTAGTQLFADYAVSGAALSETRHFLSQREPPDWPLPVPAPVHIPAQEPGAQLETGNGATTTWMFSAVGEQLYQIDAVGNRQHTTYTLAGEIAGSLVQLSQGQQTAVLHSMRYDAFGQIEQQSLGCDVIRSRRYDPADGRLKRLTTTRPGGTLQALDYQYDPVGNVIQIEDLAQPTRYFANQQTSALNTYRYDSLYQLIEATGREALGASIGPQLPDRTPNPADLSQLLNYRQTYDYDSGGNLIQLRHIGHEPYTRTMHIAPGSNRGVPSTGAPDIDSCFDANGNLKTLQPGQTLEWDLRNQLSRTVQVIRSPGLDDDERYLYDAQGQRQRKITTRHHKAAIEVSDVRYLPGLEIHTREGECLHIIVAPGVRCLHWETGNPHAPDNDQLRYTLEDHLGSSTLELDKHAAIISHEGYYPFGGTAWWAARSAVEATYKTIRYSGKERDVTGLYYYGFRYYAPWLQRWINPDPAGDVDGLNVYRMVRNNPLSSYDEQGLMVRAAVSAAAGLATLAYEQYKHSRPETPSKPASPASYGDTKAREVLEAAHKRRAEFSVKDQIEKNLSGRFDVLSNTVATGELPAISSVDRQKNNLAAIAEFAALDNATDLNKTELAKAAFIHGVKGAGGFGESGEPISLFKKVSMAFTGARIKATITPDGEEEFKQAVDTVKEEIVDTVLVGVGVAAVGNATLAAAKVLIPGAAVPITLGQILWAASSAGKIASEANAAAKKLEDIPVRPEVKERVFENIKNANAQNRQRIKKYNAFTD